MIVPIARILPLGALLMAGTLRSRAMAGMQTSGALQKKSEGD